MQRMQFTIRCKPFDRLYAGAICLQYRHQATVDQLTIHAHRTGAAFTFAAALLGSGKMQVFAQHVEQPLYRRRLNGAAFAIDSEANGGPTITHTGAVSSTA